MTQTDVEPSNASTDSEPLADCDLLTEIVMALVRKPEEVYVEREQDAQGTLCYIIYVDPTDIGKVIGKSGETISILRKLLGRIAASRHERIAIDVYDPRKTGTPSRRRAA